MRHLTFPKRPCGTKKPINRKGIVSYYQNQEAEQQAKESATKMLNGNQVNIGNSAVNETEGPASGGRTLAPEQRSFFENRLNTDLSQVKIHTDKDAQQQAQHINAKAFTQGNHVVFNEGQYQPETQSGKQLLAHELTHVVQQANTNTPVVQRDELEQSPYALQMPSRSPWWEQPYESQFNFELQMDPEIERELMMMRARAWLQRLTLANLRSDLPSLSLLDSFILAGGEQQSPLFTQALPQQEQPLVPAGAGPATPRPGSASDVLDAVLAVPSVDAALSSLQSQVLGQLEHDWESLSTGEQVFVGSYASLIGATAITAIMANDETRSFVLEQLNDRNLPVPAVPGLTFRARFLGNDPGIFFNLDLSRIIE